MITKIYVQSREFDPDLELESSIEKIKVELLIATPLVHGNITSAVLAQQEQFEGVIRTCINAPKNAIIICPEIGLHIDRQQRLIDDINTAIGDKPLQIFTQSATIFFPRHIDLVERL